MSNKYTFGAGATGAAGATAPIAQTVWGAARRQQVALFTGTALRNSFLFTEIGIYNYF
jgi:hypothetical protein